jgi:hypothetical protein
MSLDETDVQELVDQITESQSERPETEEGIKKAIVGISEFLTMPTVKDEFGRLSNTLYQYESNNQHEFNLNKIMIYNSKKTVYQMTINLTKSYYKIDTVPEEQNTISEESRKLMNPKDGILDKIKNIAPVQPKPTYLKEAVEDPYIMAYDIITQVKNVPNLWKKFVKFHEDNVLRNYAFDGQGMERCLELERWYFNGTVQTNILQIITANNELSRENDTERVAKVLTQFYQQKEKHRMDMPPQ